MIPAIVFVERCRRWVRLADALETHPERDALFQAIMELDYSYLLELQEMTARAQTNGIAAGAIERNQLREVIEEQQQKLDQALAALVAPPPPGVQAEPTH